MAMTGAERASTDPAYGGRDHLPSIAQGRRSRFAPRGDLRYRPFPQPGDAGVTAEWLRAVRVWAETRAEDSIDWYLADKRTKRLASRGLKALTIALLIGGSIVPLVTAAAGRGTGGWGYVLLAAAGGCAAFDHFFGLSSAWARDIAAVQAIQRRLDRFRLEWWEHELGSTGRGSGAISGWSVDPDAVFLIIRAFLDDLDALIMAETREWQTEFQAGIQDLRGQTGLSGPEAGSAPRGR
ncbi:SLATT domain-containing protein [Micromonospora sp. WMMD998]|uniref:SLATT domain-containing protein n=1 Tax=Micromonospora sp. WMMD998 TaxID=3016092 RepID=UPI00249A058A|nr:SLATT domain-containing protein [Micromonospora sp. WMMD998]WFE37296.1 SLATT domain-containing protein [Micromonospora sp. WMMD998]